MKQQETVLETQGVKEVQEQNRKGSSEASIKGYSFAY